MNKIKILLLALSGILISSPAWAGPAIIIGALIGGSVAAGAAALGLIAGSIFTAAAIGAAIGAVAGALGGDMLGGFFDTPDYNVAQNAQAINDGILVNKTGTLSSIPVVYGKRKVGGSIVFLTNGGERNQYLYAAVVLCEGEIDAIERVWIDEVAEDDARFSGRIEVERHLGGDNQTVSTLLNGISGWDANHRLRGLAYVVCRFQWKKIEDQDDADANPYSGIPKIQATIRGKKVKSVAGLTNSHATAYASETVAYSTNPADIVCDYLRNPRFGKGLENKRINFEAFSVARAKYAETVNYALGGTGPVMTSNTVIDTSKSILDNTKLLLANARSGMPYVQGRFKLKLQDGGNATNSQSTTPVIAFAVTRNEIVGGMKLQANGTRGHFNQVKVTYVDPENEWKTNEVIYPELNSATDQTLLAEDNGRRLTKEYSFNNITQRNIAGDLAHTLLYQSRKRKSVSFTTTAELHNVEVGDIITITYDLLAFDAAQFKVNTMKINNDYSINITATEHTPSDYVFANTEIQFASTSQTKYVGGIIPGKYYSWDGSEWIEGVAPPPTANEPTLPTTPVVKSAGLVINSVTEKLTKIGGA
tara:strand:+ start:1851 stop:3623 length:1773 start_codon:yes stop_codon:yes gene_type:complete